MKKITILIILLCIASAIGTAQPKDTIDVVYLKDGSVLRGTIIERQSYPTEQITIRTGDDLEITIAMDKVDKIVEERAGSSAAKVDDVEMGRFALEANLLGFLQFGPFVRFYIELADGLYIAPHFRAGFAGLLPWVIWGEADIGAGLSLLGYLPAANNNRVYGGVFSEYSINWDGEMAVVGGGNIGYRFRNEKRRYWNLGAIVGVSYDISWEELLFFGMLELSWGFEF